MEKPYFYHKFNVSVAIETRFYEDFILFVRDFCAQRDLRVGWTRVIELDDHVSLSFVLRGAYMIPTTLVTLGYLWQEKLQTLKKQ